jgi:hypothetical protein
MIKHELLGAGVNLKQFFEASIDALQDDYRFSHISNQTIRRNCALVQRSRADRPLANRALTDAARALTALWRT